MLLPTCLALMGVVTGLGWRLPALGRLDALLMRRINGAALPEPGDRVLAVLRLAGTTPFFIGVLVLVGLARPGWAISLAVAAILAEVMAKAMKVTVRRERPFASDPTVSVRLPRLPIDPSFPSGDAMRAAFLSGLALTLSVQPAWAAGLVVLVAIVVGFGRVRSGAHYPLDVWAGFSLGLGAAFAWAGALGL